MCYHRYLLARVTDFIANISQQDIIQFTHHHLHSRQYVIRVGHACKDMSCTICMLQTCTEQTQYMCATEQTHYMCATGTCLISQSFM